MVQEPFRNRRIWILILIKVYVFWEGHKIVFDLKKKLLKFFNEIWQIKFLDDFLLF